MKHETPGVGQESVWDYPRPPRLELSARVVRVSFNGQLIAESSRAYRVLETSHPPSWYIPHENVNAAFVSATHKKSFCEWKGAATYWTVRVGTETAENAAWSYESPTAPFAAIKGCLAFYPSILECFIDSERVRAQPGDFYGGWITREVVGPFKGIPGSGSW